MRSPGTQGALSVLFVFYMAAFAAAVLWTILSLPDLFPIFKWPYIWTAAFVRLMDYAIPVTVAGLAVAYSLFLRPEVGVRRPFHRVVGSQLTLLVTLSILYTAALFGFYPSSRTLLTELEELTREGRELLEDARRELQQGRPQEALDSFQRYLAINRRDDKVSEELDHLRAQLHATGAQRAQPPTEAAEPARGESPARLLATARSYFKREDWFSAVYYADLAVRVTGERQDAVSREAARLSARAWERIRSQEPDLRSKADRDLFERKQTGYRYYQQGDFLSAYYHFLDLSRRYPDDQDARRYLIGSRTEVMRLAYFRDEAERMDPLPGPQGLLFVNPRGDGQREIVSIGKMVSTSGETFFKDIEVLRVASGRVLLHYLAPYGRLESSQAAPDGQGQSGGPRAGVLLRGIDRRRPGQDLLPREIVGSLRGSVPRYLLALAPRPEDLPALRAPGPAGHSRLAGVSLDTLWLARAGIGAYGQLEAALSLEILMRLLLPFAFLNLGLLAMALGWSYRLVSARRPPLAAYLVIPLFPVAAALLAGAYLKVHRALAAYALLAWGFRPALIGLAVLEGAVLAVVLVLLAGRGND